MKTSYTILLLFYWPIISTAQSGYTMLKNSGLNFSTITPYSDDLKKNYFSLLQTIYKDDQAIRIETTKSFKKNKKTIDSLNFVKYIDFFKTNGYISSDKNILAINGKNIDNLLTINYVLQLHFSDFFSIEIINSIIESIPKKTCNELDLMNYFVTSLWRRTEFPNTVYFGKSLHIVLMPNLDHGKYSGYLRYAYSKFIEDCTQKDNSFVGFNISNVEIENYNIKWQNVVINGIPNLFFNKQVTSVINTLKPIINFRVKESNMLPLPNGKYSILICTHPNFSTNPTYVY